MIITVEISYFPLTNECTIPIRIFTDKLSKTGLFVESDAMSSTITGEYKIVLSCLSDIMKSLMQQHPSIFSLKISNACYVDLT